MIGFSPHNAIYFMMSQKRDVTFSKTSKLIVAHPIKGGGR